MPSQGSSRTGLVGGGGRPPGPEDPDWNGDDDAEGEEDEELVADPTPKLERDMVDSRTLQHAKLYVIPSNASGFRGWKNSIILLIGRLDISEEEVLTKW